MCYKVSESGDIEVRGIGVINDQTRNVKGDVAQVENRSSMKLVIAIAIGIVCESLAKYFAKEENNV